jgi:hypothetical protein
MYIGKLQWAVGGRLVILIMVTVSGWIQEACHNFTPFVNA